ncbi:putative Ig domain-containing protein [Corynebacterium auriscanis]|uniref:putative Ig domain-containing protein n=1 Tax=Corynebacterium auriscanis TaxID=99807 RepID=UPI00224636ED|nr:putative Ig domain-containing protein [Corynebacterium auriscanis]MCX2163704.1 putative Ig domain-containing protein [Corynebacterium auriscanis]
MKGINYGADHSASATAMPVVHSAHKGLRRHVVGFAMSAAVSAAMAGGLVLGSIALPETLAQENTGGASDIAALATDTTERAATITVVEGRAIRPVTIRLSGFAEGAMARLDGLPPGMIYTPAPVGPGQNTSEAVLTGVPTQTGFFEVTAVAVDQAGQEIRDYLGNPITRTFSIEVIPVEVSIHIQPSTQAAAVGRPIEAVSVMPGSGFTTSDLSFDAATLPPGLTFDPVTGKITGVPAAAGRYATEFKLVDEPTGKEATAVVTFDVAEESPAESSTTEATTEPTVTVTEPTETVGPSGTAESTEPSGTATVTETVGPSETAETTAPTSRAQTTTVEASLGATEDPTDTTEEPAYDETTVPPTPVVGNQPTQRLPEQPNEPRMGVPQDIQIFAQEDQTGRTNGPQPQDGANNKAGRDRADRHSAGREKPDKLGALDEADDPTLSNEAYGYPGASAGSRGPAQLENGQGIAAVAATVAVSLAVGVALLSLRRRF